jgi:hypothetical protein
MVEIFVGPSRVRFSVHEKSLSAQSPVFKSMFNTGFLEADKKSAELPDDEPEVFDAFYQWLYRDTLDEMNSKDSKRSSGPIWERIKLVCFAEKYCIDKLSNYGMDTLIECYKKEKCMPSSEAIDLAYSNTSEGSGLRLYMARSFARRIYDKESIAEEHMIELASMGDLCYDVFSVMLHRPHPTPQDPNTAARCDYHRHGKDGTIGKGKSCNKGKRTHAMM